MCIFITDRSKAVLFVDLFCCCFVFAIAFCSVFFVALWSPVGKGLTCTLALLCVTFSCAFVTFPYGVLGQVGYSIVSIPDICLLSYFLTKRVEVCFRRASFLLHLAASLYL